MRNYRKKFKRFRNTKKKRTSYRRKFKRFSRARKFTKRVQKALRKTEEQKFQESVNQAEILNNSRDFNQLLFCSYVGSPIYSCGQGTGASQRTGNKISINKVTFKFSLTPQIANDIPVGTPYTIGNYFQHANSHELVRVYFIRPRSGNNITGALTMAALILQGFPDNMDDLPSMNFLRLWKIIKVKSKTMNSIYPKLVAPTPVTTPISSLQIDQTFKSRKLNFKFKIRGPFQLNYNGNTLAPNDVPYKKQLIVVIQTSIGSALDFGNNNNLCYVCYDLDTKFRSLYTDN